MDSDYFKKREYIAISTTNSFIPRAVTKVMVHFHSGSFFFLTYSLLLYYFLRPTTTQPCACYILAVWRSPWASWRAWCSRTPRSTCTRASSSTWPQCTSWNHLAVPRRSRLCWRPWRAGRATASTPSASNWYKRQDTGSGHTPNCTLLPCGGTATPTLRVEALPPLWEW